MTRFSLILLLCSLTGTVFSQDTTEISGTNLIPVICYWNLGDVFEYTGIKEHRTFDENGLLKDSSSQEFTLSLVVADSTDSTYVIRVIQDLDWENMTMMLAKSGVDENELNELLKGQQCQALEYVIDQNGAFLEMKNLDAFAKSVTQVAHKGIVLYPENGLVYALTYEQSTYIRDKLINSYKYFMVLQEE